MDKDATYPCHFCGQPITKDEWPLHARRQHGEIIRQLCDWSSRH